MAPGTENKLSLQEYTSYIPGIFKEYTKGWAVDKRLDPVAALPPGQFIVPWPYVWGFSLYLPVPPPYFPGIHVIIICHVSSMARGVKQASAAVSARKDHTGTKKLKEKADTESSSDSDVERAAEAEAKRSREKELKRRVPQTD